jgi:hypothetical protein
VCFKIIQDSIKEEILDNRKFDFYELYYHSIKNCKNINNKEDPQKAIINKPFVEGQRLNNIVHEIYLKIQEYEDDELKFSEVICEKNPIFDSINGQIIDFIYVPRILNKNIHENPYDILKRVNSFKIENIPLIEIAKYLDISVKKKLTNKEYASFSPTNWEINLGTDDPGTFLHELSHAVDFILLQFDENNSSINEVVAELSSLFLCKENNIEINKNNSIAYIQSYLYEYVSELKGEKSFEEITKNYTKRVENIYLYIEECKKDIKMRHGV